MRFDDISEVAGPKNCWPGHRKIGTQPGTGKNAGERVNKCKKIGEEIDPADVGEYDREGDMAHSQLKTAEDAAAELRSILDADENLPEWVQAKITKAVDYLDTARDYMKSKEQGVAEGLNEMDKSAPQPGRDGKVSHSTYGSRDKKGSDYFKGTEAPGKAITAKQASKDALDILKKQGAAEGLNELFSPDELSILNQYLDDEISWHELKRGYRDLVVKAIKRFDVVSMSGVPMEFQFHDRLVQARDEGELSEQAVAEFAPAGGGTPPRGPKTPGKDPWDGNDGPGDDPYSRPEPEYYKRSIDFFGQFEADHFDDEEFDEKTGVFKGYWDDEEGRVQIAYFKFDDPRQAARDFNDSPGMGWYYEPQNESVAEGVADEKDIINSGMPLKHIERELQQSGLEKDIRIFLQWAIDNGCAYIEDAIELGEKAKLNDPQLTIGLHRLKKLSGQGVVEVRSALGQAVKEAGWGRRSSYYNPMDQERREQDAMDYSKRAFKRAELQHELGHEDDPNFERNLRQQQMDRDRGPWYIRIDGKIYRQKGQPKSFDWKRAANSYALAMIKNNPALQGKIMLTKNTQDQ